MPVKSLEYQGKQIHESVGGIIIIDKKILMVDRTIFPLGWACPGGHVDKGETPNHAIVREMKEETNLNITFANKIYEEFVEWNECSHGMKGHYWHVYVCTGYGNLKTNKEAKDSGWKTLNEIGQMNLEPVWKHWFDKVVKDERFDLLKQ